MTVYLTFSAQRNQVEFSHGNQAQICVNINQNLPEEESKGTFRTSRLLRIVDTRNKLLGDPGN